MNEAWLIGFGPSQAHGSLVWGPALKGAPHGLNHLPRRKVVGSSLNLVLWWVSRFCPMFPCQKVRLPCLRTKTPPVRTGRSLRTSTGCTIW